MALNWRRSSATEKEPLADPPAPMRQRRSRERARNVLFLHGAGLDPKLYAPVATSLGAQVRCVAPLRPPYSGQLGNVVDPAMQAEWVCGVIEQLGPTALVGIGGGGTLALEAAAIGSEGLCGVIVHEPQVGRLVPELHFAVVEAVQKLNHEVGDRAVAAYVRGIIGDDVWATMSDESRAFAFLQADAIRLDATQFADADVSSDRLRSIEAPITVTTGTNSSTARHLAADLVSRVTRAESFTMAGAGHLVCWEKPARFAGLIGEQIQRWATSA